MPPTTGLTQPLPALPALLSSLTRILLPLSPTPRSPLNEEETPSFPTPDNFGSDDEVDTYLSTHSSTSLLSSDSDTATVLRHRTSKMPSQNGHATIVKWTHACRRFKKHSGKKAEEIVSFVADAMLEPRLQAWYQGSQDCINALTLNEYIAEILALVLDKNWAHQIQPENTCFVDWRIELENLNALLTSAAKSYAVTEKALCFQLEANAWPALALALYNKPINATVKYKEWGDKVQEMDEELRAKEKRMAATITENRNQHRAERKSLLARMSDSKTNNMTTNNAPTDNAAHPCLPKLTDREHELLNEHDGCFRCRVFYAGHCSAGFPIAAAGTFPDPATFKLLTKDAALAAKATHDAKAHLPAGFVGTSAERSRRR
ncbi:hypothetical protein CPC08DRAFT_768931 [Agrocybe pediades]|nr:hypothetical protein CPC08DRAFT_768931 [Agrocybe pediades]